MFKHSTAGSSGSVYKAFFTDPHKHSIDIKTKKNVAFVDVNVNQNF